jgi:predicted ATPase
MANVLFFAAWFHQHRGEWQTVQARVEEGMTLATEQGFSRWLAQATFLQGWLLVERGQKEPGIAQMVEALATERAGIGLARWNALFAALLAEAYGKTGQTSEGLNVVNEELANARVTECCCYEADLHRIKGELLSTQAAADEGEAEACFQNASNIARGQSAKSLELRAAMSLSRLWQRQGKKTEARQLLAEVYGWFTEGFDTADLKAAKALLEELS